MYSDGPDHILNRCFDCSIMFVSGRVNRCQLNKNSMTAHDILVLFTAIKAQSNIYVDCSIIAMWQSIPDVNL